MKVYKDYKWEKITQDDDDYAKCPECGYTVSLYNLVNITPITDDLPRFCPNCGARMAIEVVQNRNNHRQ